MQSVNQDTLTDAFVAYCEKTPSPRLKLVLSKLAAHLHDFTREVGLTHEEWQATMKLLERAGQISSPERSEFILFSDVLGLTAIVDMVNSGNGRTEYSNLGPFYIAGAQWLKIGGDLIGDNDGEHVVFHGRVLDAADRKPVPGAVLDMWQTAANGLYSNQDPKQPEGNFRCRIKTDENGGYAFTTVRPAPYTVPEDGPVGDLLRATGRRPWRPAHFHFMIAAAGMRSLITEIFFDDDPYIDEDPVFGVRRHLVVRPVRENDTSSAQYPLVAAQRLRKPFNRIQYDFLI
jgi:protocatechuate 3,4-dioxygenase beta subunit